MNATKWTQKVANSCPYTFNRPGLEGIWIYWDYKVSFLHENVMVHAKTLP